MKVVIGSLVILAAGFAQAPPGRPPGLYAAINTTQAAITVRLFEKQAPVTVRNFIALARGTKAWRDPKSGKLVKRPLYPGTTFYRVVPHLMIQGGDPAGTGLGDPGFTIPDELSAGLNFDVPGRLAMANLGPPHTGNCQFFITVAPAPHLDGLYTIFGQVVEGQDVVAKIARLPAVGEKPRTPVRITGIVIRRENPPSAQAAVRKP
jgi:peptidyl-prolyl cis-trans isomerase A (cyclophilin A)